MAWPKDTARYLPPSRSKLQEKADELTGNAATATGRVINALPATRLARSGLGMAGQAVSRLAQDAGARSANAATIDATNQNRAYRTALGTANPQGRTVAVSSPAKRNFTASRDIPGMGPLLTRAPLPPSQTPSQVTTQSPEVAQARSSLMKRYSNGRVEEPLSGTQRVGNMDVTFDKSVPLPARRAFMEQPVEPTGQMERYDAYASTPTGQYYGARSLPGSSEPATINTFGDVMRERRRMAIDKQEADVTNEEERRRLEEQGQMLTADLGAQRNAIDEQGQNITAGLGMERNRIDAANIAGQDRARQSEIEARDLEIQDKLAMKQLNEAYVKETDPVKKKELEMQIRTLMGKPQDKFQIVTRKDAGPNGEVIETPYMVTPDGTATPVGEGQQAPELPPRDKAARVVGKKYVDATGNTVTWDGTGFVRG